MTNVIFTNSLFEEYSTIFKKCCIAKYRALNFYALTSAYMPTLFYSHMLAGRQKSEIHGDRALGPATFLNSQVEGRWVQRLKPSLDYMAQNIQSQSQVSVLAEMANMSPSNFFARFKQMTGCSPINYLKKLRIWRACQLLNSNSLRVKEVAAAVGYRDPLYFSRMFKSLASVAPVHYRSLEVASKLEIQARLKPVKGICERDNTSLRIQAVGLNEAATQEFV